MNADEMLCRWAEHKYKLATVVAVDFEFADDGDWSEVTPGDGPYINVDITYLSKGREPQRHTRRESTYDTALIREIIGFALNGESK